jgi:hypothetical protein
MILATEGCLLVRKCLDNYDHMNTNKSLILDAFPCLSFLKKIVEALNKSQLRECWIDQVKTFWFKSEIVK